MSTIQVSYRTFVRIAYLPIFVLLNIPLASVSLIIDKVHKYLISKLPHFLY